MKNTINQTSRIEKSHFIKISATVCSVQDVLSRCTKEKREELKNFSKCLKDIYSEAGKENPDTDFMKKLFEGVKEGYKTIDNLMVQGGPSSTALSVLKESARTLYSLMETYINHL
ncbi:MAG: hypothetical protein ACR2IQ_00575 [Minisyncoccia bacterium]